jgi:hypothetical protein
MIEAGADPEAWDRGSCSNQLMSKRRHFRRNRRLRADSPNCPEDIAPAAAAEIQPWQAVRPEKIERARELIRDENYPSKEILESVADLLANGLDNGK